MMLRWSIARMPATRDSLLVTASVSPEAKAESTPVPRLSNGSTAMIGARAAAGADGVGAAARPWSGISRAK